MKTKKGFSVVWIIVVAIIAGFTALVVNAINSKNAAEEEKTAAETALDEKVKELNLQNILAASDDNGQMGDNVYGPKDAKVTIYEYADYQCEYCALFFPYVSEVVDEYAGKVNLVHRGLVLSYHKNGNAAASAANAAALQGYWHKYATVLFKNQESWKGAKSDDLTQKLEEYFRIASNAKGDLEQFRSDKASERVQDKIAFDAAIARTVGISATPTFYVGTEEVELKSTDKEETKATFRAAIDKALAELNDQK